MEAEPRSPPRRWLLAGLGMLLILAGLTWLPVGDVVLVAIDRLRSLGPMGAVPFSLVYVVATLVLVPATPFTLAAGFLYGPTLGFVAAWMGEVGGALLAWALGRGLLREQARRISHRYAILRALDHALEGGGFRLLVLVRLSPLFPFGPLNYFLGMTGVQPLPYAAATAVGVAPLCLLFAYAGSTLPHLSAALAGEASLGRAEGTAYWGGLVATVLAVLVVTRATRAALIQELDD